MKKKLSFVIEDSVEDTTMESAVRNIQEKAKEITDRIAEKRGIPKWIIVTIFILIAIVLGGFLVYKYRSKYGKADSKGISLQAVRFLASANQD